MSFTSEDFLAQVNVLSKQMFNYSRRCLFNPEDVEDVFADAVLSAWSERSKFLAGSNFKSWMYRILLNKIYATNRRYVLAEKASQRLAREGGSSAVQNDSFSELDCSDEMMRALASLNDTEREAFLLLSLSGLTYAEISQATNAPVTTVITRLGRARSKLKTCLRGTSCVRENE